MFKLTIVIVQKKYSAIFLRFGKSRLILMKLNFKVSLPLAAHIRTGVGTSGWVICCTRLVTPVTVRFEDITEVEQLCYTQFIQMAMSFFIHGCSDSSFERAQYLIVYVTGESVVL